MLTTNEEDGRITLSISESDDNLISITLLIPKKKNSFFNQTFEKRRRIIIHVKCNALPAMIWLNLGFQDEISDMTEIQLDLRG